MEVSDQLHALAALPPRGKGGLDSMEKRKYALVESRNACSLVAIPKDLSRLEITRGTEKNYETLESV
jgi:hypothetical protein